MQKGDIYTVFNEKSAKYKELTKILKENDHLMECRAGERVLDVGCGPGDVTTNVILPRLAPDFSLLLGVDISSKMTQHGLSHYANDRIHFETLDVGMDISDFLQNEKYSAGFHKIFSFYVMNWVKDLEMGVSNLYRLLCPRGQALLMFPVNRHFQKTYKTISAREPWSQYFKDITRKISPYLTGENPCREFQNMLITAGFEVTKCETKHQHDVFDCIDVLKDLIESLDQHISCVPKNLKSQYLNECVQIMQDMKAMQIDDGKVLVKVTKIVTVVIKPQNSRAESSV